MRASAVWLCYFVSCVRGCPPPVLRTQWLLHGARVGTWLARFTFPLDLTHFPSLPAQNKIDLVKEDAARLQHAQVCCAVHVCTRGLCFARVPGPYFGRVPVSADDLYTQVIPV
jgi:hypothetical protein